MAKRKKRKSSSYGIADTIGRLSTQPVIVTEKKGTNKEKTSSATGRGSTNSLGRVNRVAPGLATTARRTSPRPSVTAIFSKLNSKGLLALSSQKLVAPGALTFTAAAQQLPIRLANRIPLFKFQIPLLRNKPIDKFSEDILDVSEIETLNSEFVPIGKNGISSFRPEILQITDFLPIWKQKPNKRTSGEFTPAGKLLDVQYNSLWLRRDTIIGLFEGLSKENKEGTKQILEDLKSVWLQELEHTDQTIKWFSDFLEKTEIIKNLLDIKGIPRSDFSSNFLPLDDFFDRRMQFSKEKLETFSDTKVILQLLADFKQITENYSTSLLDLEDADRVNDYSPVSIDTTYTLNDGFTFTVEQIRSANELINASQSDFFNTFLNSLPNDADSRLKLLITLLSKEYRISKNLGVPQTQKKLLDVFAANSAGSPFDNIIGIPGSNIFTQPLGPNSLSSLFVRPIGENSIVLPLEKKYVDAQDIKKTFIPGSTYLVDALLSSDSKGNSFNTAPYVDYSNEVSERFNQVNSMIRALYDADNENSINPEKLINMLYSSFRSSISGMQNISNINKDQAVITAIFKLANTDNELKNKLFQFCLLVGLASNDKVDKKPIFSNLASEFGSIHNFSALDVSKDKNPSLNNGLQTLRPYIEQLAADIENRVLSLTTPEPKYNTSVVLRSSPDYTKFRTTRSSKDTSPSAFTRLSIAALSANQSTINIPRFMIRRILLSNVDPKSSNTTNVIKEFVDLANAIAQISAQNGTSVYLLDDQTGRTRFNFLSTSTQLLLLFELISSLSSKYSFSDFGRSRSVFNAFVTVDTQKNNFVTNVINEILSARTKTASTSHLSTSPGGRSRTGSSKNTLDVNTNINITTFSKMLHTTSAKITRSGKSTASKNNLNSAGSALSLVGSTEEALLHNKLGSPFLGNEFLNKIGSIGFSNLNFTRETVNIRSALIAIKNKTITEDRIIGNILHILSVIEQRIRSGKNKIANFFNDQILAAFLKDNSIETLKLILNPSQVRTSAFMQREARNRLKAFTPDGDTTKVSNYLVDPEVVFPQTRNALYSLLTEPQYLLGENADLRTKIITVGIPSGFSQQLTDRINHAEVNKTSFKEKQFDVVIVKVYKRDQRFEEIIFKPKTFLFDLSLFQEEILSTQAREGENYSRVVERNKVLDLETISLQQTTYRTLENISEDPKYDFLTRDQKKSLIYNHTTSSMLRLYLQMLTGMKINETTFSTNVVKPGTELNEKLTNLIFTYLRDTLNKNIPNQNIQELLKDTSVDDETKDILRLITYGNLIFDPKSYRSKVISPKIFDRVFHVAFNTEEFEIDEEATRETETGRNAIEKTSMQERLVYKKGKVFFVPKSRNELVFEDYFIVVENSI